MKVRRPVIVGVHAHARGANAVKESASVSLIRVQLLHLRGLFSRGGPLNTPTGLPVFSR